MNPVTRSLCFLYLNKEHIMRASTLIHTEFGFTLKLALTIIASRVVSTYTGA